MSIVSSWILMSVLNMGYYASVNSSSAHTPNPHFPPLPPPPPPPPLLLLIEKNNNISILTSTRNHSRRYPYKWILKGFPVTNIEFCQAHWKKQQQWKTCYSFWPEPCNILLLLLLPWLAFLSFFLVIGVTMLMWIPTESFEGSIWLGFQEGYWDPRGS